MFLSLLQQIMVIFLEMGVGVVGVRTGVIHERDSKFLSEFIMKLLLPCTMLAASQVEGGRAAAKEILLGIVLTTLFFGLHTLVCEGIVRLTHMTPGQRAALVGTTVMPNASFVGIPLCTAVLGAELGVIYPTAAMTAYNVWFFTYVFSLFHPGERFNPKSLATPTNFATLALLVMLALGLRLPAPLYTFVKAVGGCTTPLALAVLGVMLSGSKPRDVFTRPFIYLVILLRNLLFPLSFFLFLRMLPVSNTLALGLSIAFACPSGTLVGVLAKQCGLEEELVSGAVAGSTLLMLATVPLMVGVAVRIFPLG